VHAPPKRGDVCQGLAHSPSLKLDQAVSLVRTSLDSIHAERQESGKGLSVPWECSTCCTPEHHFMPSGPTTAAGMCAAKGWRTSVVPALLIGTFGYATATFLGVALGVGVLRGMASTAILGTPA